MILIIICLFPYAQSLCFNIQQGIYKEFNILVDPNFICVNGVTFQRTIQFQCPFPQTPQVIITLISYKYDKDPQFQFQIISQTINDWTFQISCISTAQLYKYEFTWLAVNDNRLLVINDYMATTQLVTGFQTPSTPNYLVSLQVVSFYGGGYLIAGQGTLSNAYLLIQQGQPGLGVQLITTLTPLNIWQTWGNQLIYNVVDTTTVYVYQDPNIIPIQSLFKLIDTYDDTYRDLQYSEVVLENGNRAINATGYGGGTFQQFFTLYNASKLSVLPHGFKKMRISKRIDISYQIYMAFNFQQLYFIELKQTLKDVESLNLYNVSSQQYSFTYYYLCRPGRKITGNLFQIRKCVESQYKFVQYCHKGVYLLTMHIELYQQYQSNRDLYFELTSQSLKIDQTIHNIDGTTDTYTLVDLQVTNQ